MTPLNNQKGFTAFEVVLIVLVLAATGVAGYFSLQANQDKTDYSVQVAKKQSSNSTKPDTGVKETTSIYVIDDLGLKFTLSSAVGELTHKVVRLEGEQAVSTVAFSTKSLEASGCNIESAPLGHLTYTEGKGGVFVARARSSNLYYIEPKNSCGSNWQKLKSSLNSLISTE
jgi:hypothetical protein